MSGRALLSIRGRNPDVLTCIANLSNDEVFTPPALASQMLDTLAEVWAVTHGGENVWANSSVRFLDPCAKSGVFLREIASRLTRGLAEEIPDLQTRVDHILTHQVFGIASTYLTSLLSRRSVYCSKLANGKHSVARSFASESGHVWFQRTQHVWVKGRCRYCGASRNTLDRGDDRETYAYPFIHTDNVAASVAEMFGGGMQFDVIIGNPPYQLASDGGTRDVPIYQHFVEQAKKLEPRLLMMVIPSRWMAGGLGLTEFRQTMLHDTRIRTLVDYQNAAEVFPSVGINGGICYFLWDASYDGPCDVSTIRAGEVLGPTSRSLSEFDVLVRDNRALTILRKVLQHAEPSVNTILARDKEFGWTSNFDGFRSKERKGDIPLYYIRAVKRSRGFISRSEIQKSQHLIDTWKVLVPAVGSGRERERSGVDLVLGPPLIAPSPSVCTQSFLFFYVSTQNEAESLQSYYKTRFFRFLVSLRKITQHATHSTYRWVPMQKWDRIWTDAALYEKYGITDSEQAYIESTIRPMVDRDD
jgi:site-specific DNA-methyltransferase (adenine-specific)